MPDTLARLQAALGPGYRIERELGGGGMSRVFLAEDTQLGRRVVAKVLPDELAAASSAERFARETRVVASLQHPNIVPLISAGGNADLLWFTMPFVEGESLRERLDREGELPLDEALRLWTEILDALDYAHGRGIVHRDIKPENVLLSGRHAMVADFGVARALVGAADATRATGTGMALGTPAYMSPEQAVGDTNVDARADLYAAGLVMYEMLCGVGPYNERNPARLMVAHATQPVPDIRSRRPQVNPELEGLVLRCLEKRPADRPQSAAEVLAALGRMTPPAAVAGSSGTAAAVAAASAAKLPRSRRGLLVAAVSLVVVLGAGAAWWFGGAGVRGGSITSESDTSQFSLLVLPPSADARDSLLMASILETLLGRLRADRRVFVGSTDNLPPPEAATPRVSYGWRSRDSLIRWAPDMRVHSLLSLSLARTEPGYLLSVSVRAVANDSTLVSVQRSASDAAGLPAAVEDVLAEVSTAVTRAVGRVPEPRPTGAMFRISPDAAQLWREADDAFARREFAEAAEAYRSAARLNPEFTMFWLMLHHSLVNAGLNRDERLRAIAKAYRLRDSIPVIPMRFTVAADYHRLRGDYQAALEIYQRFEREGVSLNANNQAIALQNVGRLEDAARIYARVRDTTYVRPGLTNSNYVGALLDLQRVEEAERELALLDSIAGPEHPTTRVARLMLLRHRRDPDSVLAELRPQLAGDLSAGMRLSRLGIASLAELTRGALGQGRRLLAERSELLRRFGSTADLMEDRLDAISRLARLGGDVQGLRRELAEVYVPAEFAALAPMDRPYQMAINAHAVLGLVEEAKRLADEADRVIPEEFRGTFEVALTGARGEIALAEGRGAEALRLFRAADTGGACTACWYGEYATAFELMANADSALYWWERYVDTPSWRMFGNDAVFLARAYRRAGELREARGDVARALEHYRNFVQLWHDADPDLQVQVRDVQQRIARLEAGRG